MRGSFEGRLITAAKLRSVLVAMFLVATLCSAPSAEALSLRCLSALVETLPAPRLVVERDRELAIQVAPPGGWSRWMNGAAKVAGGPLGVRALSRLWFRAKRGDPSVPATSRLLETMDVRIVPSGEPLENIPRTGPLVVVANHPRFGLDGIALADVLLRLRPDVKVLMNAFMSGVPEIAALGIAVGDSRAEKVAALREATDWLAAGHVVVVFPAGAISTVFENGRYVDPPWISGASRLAQRARAPVLPVFVDGGPTPFFHQMRSWHVRTSYFLMVRELLAQQGQTVNLRFRPLFDVSTVSTMAPDDLLQAIRAAVYD